MRTFTPHFLLESPPGKEHMANNQLTLTIKANATMLQTALKQAQASVDSFANKMKSGVMANARDLKNAFDTAGRAIESVFKRVATTALSGSFGVAAFIKSAAGLQASAQSMKVLTGNTEVANKLFSQLAKYANTTPFDFPEIAKAGKTLLGFGIESEKVFGHIQMLGDIAAATGADFDSLALVFGQVNATGRLMGQDSLQLINNNIPITTILAKKLGISVQQVKDQMEKGKIGVDLFNEALLETTQKGGFAFHGTGQLAQTLNGRMSTLKDTVMEVGRNLVGVKIDPNNGGLIIEQDGLFDKFSKTIERATKWLNENKETVKKIANVVIDNFVPAISALATVFILAKVAALAFNIAMYANPIMIIVGAVLALIGVLVFLQVKFNIFGKAWDFIKGVWSGAAKWFGELFGAIGDAIGSAVEFIGSIISSIGDFFKGIWDTVVGVFNGVVDFIREWGLTILAIILFPISLVIGFFFTFKDQIFAVFQVIWQFISGVFVGIYNTIVAIITPVIGFISGVFKGAWNMVIAVWNGVTGFFGGVWNGIVNIFSGVAGWFAGVFQGAWNGIRSIFSGVGGFFRGVWDTIVGIFGKVGSAVGNAIGGAVKGVVNAILGFAERTINTFIKAINVAIGIINAIPGVHIPVLAELKIPRLATGGIVSPQGGGSIIYAGDGGQNEWVVPESKMASLVNQINNRSSGGGVRDVILNINVETHGSRFSEEDAVDMAQKINMALKAQGLKLNQLGALR